MHIGRVVLIVSAVVVAALGGWFAVARWDDANKVAAILSALGAVAAVGVTVWAALRVPPSRKSLVVSDTGRAVAGSGGRAITGISGAPDGVDGPVRVERTGDADATGGGDAVTGVHQD